ncbi:unnamed protein product [Cladocopium goreaui]|uniref:Sorting nexin-22 n=1 Tax=Cladocopium goreaui TaxID=2562237 RepID=A0A9P1GEK0_9DINO|nr:unnamed protein product [Cladocopium goreaui]
MFRAHTAISTSGSVKLMVRPHAFSTLLEGQLIHSKVFHGFHGHHHRQLELHATNDVDPAISGLRSKMWYEFARKKSWSKAIRILSALSEAPLDANGHFKDYDFVSGLVRFLPILVGTCAQVSQWLPALAMTKGFLSKASRESLDLLPSIQGIVKALAAENLARPALSLLPEVLADPQDPTESANAPRTLAMLMEASFQCNDWMVAVCTLELLHVSRCGPHDLDRATAKCVASCPAWPLALTLRRSMGVRSYSSFAKLCGSGAWPIALQLAQDGARGQRLSQSSILLDSLLTAQVKEQRWQDSFDFFKGLGSQKGQGQQDGTSQIQQGSSSTLTTELPVDEVRDGWEVMKEDPRVEVKSHWIRRPTRPSFDALIRSCCDGFRDDVGWLESFRLLETLKANFGSFQLYDAYTLCEVLRACVSGAQWQRSLKFLDLLGPERHPDTRSLSYILAIRACSMPRHWLAVLSLLACCRNQRVRPHIGMYDAAIFSCKGTWEHPWSQWRTALRILEEAHMKHLRCNPFMLQGTLRACQSNHEWRPSMALLRACLGNSIEAHENQYAAALGVCAKAIQWSWGLQLVRDDMQRLYLKISNTALKPCIDIFQESGSWQEATTLLRRVQEWISGTINLRRSRSDCRMPPVRTKWWILGSVLGMVVTGPLGAMVGAGLAVAATQPNATMFPLLQRGRHTIANVSLPRDGMTKQQGVTYFAVDVVDTNGFTWRLLRRYSHFSRFQALMNNYEIRCVFPGKTFFSCSGNELEQRRLGLEAWTRDMLRVFSSTGIPNRLQAEFEDFFTRGRSEARPPAPPLPPAAPAPAPPAPPALGQAFAVEVPGGVHAGQQLMVKNPMDGSNFLITVPLGTGPGSILQVSPPADASGLGMAVPSSSSVQAPAAGAEQKILLSISIPPGVSAGQTLGVKVPDGRELTVVVPPGLGQQEVQLEYDTVSGSLDVVTSQPSAPAAPSAPPAPAVNTSTFEFLGALCRDRS